MQKYMFDTNIFNALLDGKVDLSNLIGKAKYYATHIQRDEINKTPDNIRRKQLKDLFTAVTSDPIPTESFVLDTSRLDYAKLGGENVIPTESAVFGISKFGKAKYTPNDNLYIPILQELDNHKQKENNKEDALIAETAIKNDLILVTHDRDLFNIVTRFGGACTNLFQVIAELQDSN